MELRIGVIGTGAIGEDHIRRLTDTITGARVVALSDINKENALRVSKKYNVTFYETGYEVIWSPDVDAVVIASWDPTHAEFVLECIKAKKYVLCEKPLGISAEECMTIVKAEAAGGKKLVQVGFMRRYDKGYRKLKEIIESGEIGEPLMVHCCHRNRIPGPQHTTDMTIKNSGIHEIDILRWLLGEDYESGQVLMAKQNQNALDGLKDPQIMLLKTKSGVRIDVEVNMNSHYGYDIQCEIVGEKGVIRLPDPTSILKKKSGMGSHEILSDWSQRFVEAYDVEFQQWINSIKESGPVGPNSWDGYVAAVTADTLIKARKLETIEPIILEPQPAFYC